MQKSLFAFTLLFVFTLTSFAFASDTLLDTISQYSTEELLQLRELIDEELEQRNATISPAYILNVNTRKFHFPSCSSVKEMKEKNKLEFFGERDELIAREYAPCMKCNP